MFVFVASHTIFSVDRFLVFVNAEFRIHFTAVPSELLYATNLNQVVDQNVKAMMISEQPYSRVVLYMF